MKLRHSSVIAVLSAFSLLGCTQQDIPIIIRHEYNGACYEFSQACQEMIDEMNRCVLELDEYQPGRIYWASYLVTDSFINHKQ
jgi:hypothetical protein